MSKIRFASEEYVNNAMPAAPDWGAAIGEPGYIENRTHWSSEKLNIVIPETTETSLGGELFGDATITKPIIQPDEEYVVIVDGVQYKCMSTYDSQIAGLVIGDSRLYPDAQDNPADVPFFIHQWIVMENDAGTSYEIDFYYPDSETHTISIAEATGELEYHPLDIEYLPMNDICEDIMSRMSIAEEASF